MRTTYLFKKTLFICLHKKPSGWDLKITNLIWTDIEIKLARSKIMRPCKIITILTASLCINAHVG